MTAELFLSPPFLFVPSEFVRPQQLPRVLPVAGPVEKQLPTGGTGEGGELPRGDPAHRQLHRDQPAGTNLPFPLPAPWIPWKTKQEPLIWFIFTPNPVTESHMDHPVVMIIHIIPEWNLWGKAELLPCLQRLSIS